MTTRLYALQTGSKTYHSTCAASKHHKRRWTGSGLCADCYPKKRGTMVQAMAALFGDRSMPIDEAKSLHLPLFRATCKHGHNSWRYVKTPLICLECVAAARVKARYRRREATIAYPIDPSFPPGMTLEIAQALGLPLDKLY